MTAFQTIKNQLQKHNTLVVLIVVNLMVFFVINISTHILNLNITPFLALPLNIPVFVFHFWTLFTYMFSHQDLGHLFYNMILFYFSAQTFLNFLSEKKLFYVYVTSGLSGGLILLVLSAFFPPVFMGSYLFGASAAIIGVLCVLAVYIPDLPVNLFGIIQMKYKYYALLVFVLFTIIDFTVNTGGKISHIGGACFGLLYGYMLKNGKDLFDLNFYKPKQQSKMKVVYNNTQSVKTNKDNTNQQMIDELLDKISKNGYENLSKAEKELLFKLSQKK